MNNKMHLYYDAEGDFLEISVGKPTKSIAEEVKPGVFVRKDEKTGEINSIGIISFNGRGNGLKNIDLELPITIDFMPA